MIFVYVGSAFVLGLFLGWMVGSRAEKPTGDTVVEKPCERCDTVHKHLAEALTHHETGQHKHVQAKLRKALES